MCVYIYIIYVYTYSRYRRADSIAYTTYLLHTLSTYIHEGRQYIYSRALLHFGGVAAHFGAEAEAAHA